MTLSDGLWGTILILLGSYWSLTFYLIFVKEETGNFLTDLSIKFFDTKLWHENYDPPFSDR